MVDPDRIRSRFPMVTAINSDLSAEGISLLILAVRKERRGFIREIARELTESGLIAGFKFVVFVDSPVDVHYLSDVAWIAANNLDPRRDCFILRANGVEFAPSSSTEHANRVRWTIFPAIGQTSL